LSRIAAIGHLSRDVVARGEPRPGGPVFYAARALADLATSAHIAASCSAAHREELLPPLERLGLPVRWFESSKTTQYSFEYEGEQRNMRQTAVGDPWSPAQAVEAVRDARWVHVGALTRTDFPEETLAALASQGRTLLIDAQGLVRRPTLGPLEMDSGVGAALEFVTILKLSEEESGPLVGSAAPEDLRALGVPEVLLTLGSRGSFVVTPEVIEHVEAHEVPTARDPTGAGDTFAAAYLAARALGDDPVAAAHEATAAAANLLRGA
jgi:sugar/nucleoside kinase (ribokinase family)